MLWLVVFAAVAALLAGALIPRGPATGKGAPNAEAPWPRIVAISPAIAVILDDLGLSEHIVGRHAFDIILDDSVPVVGDTGGIDYERLLRINPTHILLEQSAQAIPDRLRSLAGDHGWSLHTVALLSLDDIPRATSEIAGLFESESTRRRLAGLLASFEASLEPRPDVARRAGRVLPLYWTDPPGAAGPGSFHYEMLERLGFEMALPDGGPFITVDPEDVLRMDPDSILLLVPGADPSRVDELLGPLARLDLRCVREGRVGVINDPLVNIPATSITRVVREIMSVTANWPVPAARTAAATN